MSSASLCEATNICLAKSCSALARSRWFSQWRRLLNINHICWGFGMGDLDAGCGKEPGSAWPEHEKNAFWFQDFWKRLKTQGHFALKSLHRLSVVSHRHNCPWRGGGEGQNQFGWFCFAHLLLDVRLLSSPTIYFEYPRQNAGYLEKAFKMQICGSSTWLLGPYDFGFFIFAPGKRQGFHPMVAGTIHPWCLTAAWQTCRFWNVFHFSLWIAGRVRISIRCRQGAQCWQLKATPELGPRYLWCLICTSEDRKDLLCLRLGLWIGPGDLLCEQLLGSRDEAICSLRFFSLRYHNHHECSGLAPKKRKHLSDGFVWFFFNLDHLPGLVPHALQHIAEFPSEEVSQRKLRLTELVEQNLEAG